MPDEHFSSHLPAVLASTTATLVATFGLSFLGYAGTLIGLVGGSLITGSGAWLFERWYRKTAAVARAKAAAVRQKGSPLTAGETQMIERVTEARQPKTRGVPWRLAGMSAGAALVACAAVVAVIELGTGKPVSAVVQGKAAHGFVVPVASPTVTVTAQAGRKTRHHHHRPVITPSSEPPSSTIPVTPSTIPVTPSARLSQPAPTVVPSSPSASASSVSPTPTAVQSSQQGQ